MIALYLTVGAMLGLAGLWGVCKLEMPMREGLAALLGIGLAVLFWPLAFLALLVAFS